MTIRRTRKPPKPKAPKRVKAPPPPPRPLPCPEGGMYPGPTGDIDPAEVAEFERSLACASGVAHAEKMGRSGSI